MICFHFVACLFIQINLNNNLLHSKYIFKNVYLHSYKPSFQQQFSITKIKLNNTII